jgi:hypothetical protein
MARIEWPINSEELARRLLGHQREPEYGRFLQAEVRPLLREFRCPKAGTTRQAQWVVDRGMAQRVAERLGRTLR